MNIFLFLSLALSLTLILGKIIEKIRIPWVFSALFLGLLLSFYNPFIEITTSESFNFIADLGMYFLLFIIGLEINIKELIKQNKFIAKLSFSLIFFEAFFGSLLIHFVFDISWGISLLVASSFATVGEAVLIPILDEFKLTKTRFGQSILGIGTIDDIAEIIVIIIASFVLKNSEGYSNSNFFLIILLLSILFFLPIFLYFYKRKIHRFNFEKVPPLFLFGLIFLFLFIGIGSLTESSALGAILAGISLKQLLSKEKLQQFESIIRIVAYGFFVPLFFISVGSEIDLIYLFSAPLLILSFVLLTKITKITVSYFFGKKKFGTKKSILLGVALSAKFSSSIVIITLLFEQNIIPQNLYSVLIGAMIISKFIIPVTFTVLLKKWKLKFKNF